MHFGVFVGAARVPPSSESCCCAIEPAAVGSDCFPSDCLCFSGSQQQSEQEQETPPPPARSTGGEARNTGKSEQKRNGEMWETHTHTPTSVHTQSEAKYNRVCVCVCAELSDYSMMTAHRLTDESLFCLLLFEQLN